MSPLTWNDNNHVGNATIDQQHRQWVEIFNQLEAGLTDVTRPPSPSQTELLQRILDFTREHFREEERLMALNGYPDAVKHRRMHKEFELLLYERFRMVTAGELVLQSELIALIRHWFVHHTSSEDKRTFDYINTMTTRKEQD